MSNKNIYESDPSFLARWAENKLTAEEVQAFEKTEAYQEFLRIDQTALELKAPPVDKAAALQKIKEKIHFKKKVISFKPYWYAAAASVVVLLGLFSLFNATTSYTIPNGGEHLAIVLPDGSKVQLNAGSELTHKRFFWKNNRTLHLKGEGYFEVEKGQTFTVETDFGNVSVLGTKFNVKARKNNFDLHCFEGAVRFDQKDTGASKVLYKDDAISITNNTTIKEEKTTKNVPNWMQQISIFKEQPLQTVLEELSVQYNVSFETKTTDVTRLFSGSFVHNNLDIALKTTLTPMGISFTLSKDKKTVYLP
ncbi:FecR family protein [Tenacibaculum agarivorans]|uniref:FecR family protein n=1 Tax=Tenacibaculum agarivorans TaxID=1908389 RepID=UPI00094B9D63|nr:FecR family protein [Tenacibaculum agarivorans]